MEMHARHVVFRWSAYEHEFIERDSDWFWALGIIALSGAVISVLFHDFLFAVVILVAAFAFGVLATTVPQLATFEVSERGIRINGKLHRYHEIISFWVEDEHHDGRPFLLLSTVKFMSPHFVIPIEGLDPQRLRMFLRKHAKEVPMKEPIAHRIIDFVGL